MIMQRLFVTGASGFIGKNFINAALQKDFKIIAIRRNNSFTEPNQDSKIEWIDCDLLDLNEKMLTSSDMVIHLASEGVSPKEVEFKEPSFDIINNVTAQTEKKPENIKELLVKQIFSTVKWRDSILKMSEFGISNFIEIGPGKVLSGMVKRTIKNANCFSINSIADINFLINELKK